MSQIIKAFTGLFMALYMMIAAISLIGMFFEVLYAQNLHAVIVDELENSNYAQAVIEESFSVTEQMGYGLELILYPRHETIICLNSSEEIPEVVQDISMAKVKLIYPFKLGMWGIDLEQILFGYAR